MSREEYLLGNYIKNGYQIQENGDCSVIIRLNGTVIAVFNQPNITPKEIQDVCRRHKESLTAAKI